MQNILITGISTGIGFELTKQYLALGHKVFGSVRTEAAAKEAREVHGDRLFPVVMDVTNEEQLLKGADYIKGILDGAQLDILINNAGIAVGGPLLHVSIEQMRYQMEVNVIGLLRVTQVFAPFLGAVPAFSGKPGRIIMISSVAGKIGMPFIGPYAASKHALEGLSQSLRREMMMYGIKVIVIGPGAVKTPIWDKSITPVSQDFTHTPYAKVLVRFRDKLVVKSAENGLEVADVCQKIVNISQQKDPNHRYTFVSKRFTNWFLPRYLPGKWFDAILAKILRIKS